MGRQLPLQLPPLATRIPQRVLLRCLCQQHSNTGENDMLSWIKDTALALGLLITAWAFYIVMTDLEVVMLWSRV